MFSRRVSKSKRLLHLFCSMEESAGQPDEALVYGPAVAPSDYWETPVLEEDGRCCLCPHPADLNHPMLGCPTMDPAEAPWTDFRCGHSVHSNCYLILCVMNRDGDVGVCPVCRQNILTPEQSQWMRTTAAEQSSRAGRRRKIEKHIRNLWEKNPVFREDLKILRKKNREFSSIATNFRKDISQFKKEFQEKVKPAVEIIKGYKKDFTKRFQASKFRKPYLTGYSRISRLNRVFTDTYDLDRYDLWGLRKIPGIPSMKFLINRRSFRRTMSYYLFHVHV